MLLRESSPNVVHSAPIFTTQAYSKARAIAEYALQKSKANCKNRSTFFGRGWLIVAAGTLGADATVHFFVSAWSGTKNAFLGLCTLVWRPKFQKQDAESALQRFEVHPLNKCSHNLLCGADSATAAFRIFVYGMIDPNTVSQQELQSVDTNIITGPLKNLINGNSFDLEQFCFMAKVAVRTTQYLADSDLDKEKKEFNVEINNHPPLSEHVRFIYALIYALEDMPQDEPTTKHMIKSVIQTLDLLFEFLNPSTTGIKYASLLAELPQPSNHSRNTLAFLDHREISDQQLCTEVESVRTNLAGCLKGNFSADQRSRYTNEAEALLKRARETVSKWS